MPDRIGATDACEQVHSQWTFTRIPIELLTLGWKSRNFVTFLAKTWIFKDVDSKAFQHIEGENMKPDSQWKSVGTWKQESRLDSSVKFSETTELNIYLNFLGFPTDFHLRVCRPRIISVNKELRQLENLPKVIPSLIFRKIHFSLWCKCNFTEFPWQKLFRVCREVLHACGTSIKWSGGLQGTERRTWKTILDVLLDGCGLGRREKEAFHFR